MLPDGCKVRYQHERIPRLVEDMCRVMGTRRKGPPRESYLFPYSPRYGFFNVDADTLISPRSKEPSHHGGRTVAIVYDRNDEVIATGVATCSMSDRFNYKIGRQIALGRALSKLTGRRQGPTTDEINRNMEVAERSSFGNRRGVTGR